MGQNREIKQSVRMAFCGVLAALGVVVLFLTGVIPVATIALPAIAGCVLIPVVAECGVKWGFSVFGVTAALAFFLSGDREAFLIYLLFFGYYPVLYAVLQRLKKKALRWLLKLAVFNAAAIADVLIVTYVFGMPLESIAMLGAYTPLVLLLLANGVFVVYDLALGSLIAMYFARLHNVARRMLGLR